MPSIEPASQDPTAFGFDEPVACQTASSAALVEDQYDLDDVIRASISILRRSAREDNILSVDESLHDLCRTIQAASIDGSKAQDSAWLTDDGWNSLFSMLQESEKSFDPNEELYSSIGEMIRAHIQGRDITLHTATLVNRLKASLFETRKDLHHKDMSYSYLCSKLDSLFEQDSAQERELKRLHDQIAELQSQLKSVQPLVEYAARSVLDTFFGDTSLPPVSEGHDGKDGKGRWYR